MSDFDKELKIKIITAADTSALKQTSAALKEVAGAAENNLRISGELPDTPAMSGTTGPSGGVGEPGGRFPAAPAAVPAAFDSLAEAARFLLLAAAAIKQQFSETQLSSPANPYDSEQNFRTGNLAKFSPSSEENNSDSAALPAAPRMDFSPSIAFADSSRGRQMDSGQTALLHSLEDLLQLSHESTRALLDVVRQGQQDQAALQNEIAGLKRSIAQLTAARANAGIPTPP